MSRSHDSKFSLLRITKQALNSLRSLKNSDHNVVKISFELNFRHSRFISYLFTIHSQGLLHFTPHGIHFNHDLRNSFSSNHDSQSTKNPHYGDTLLLLELMSLFAFHGEKRLQMAFVFGECVRHTVNHRPTFLFKGVATCTHLKK